MRQLAIIHRSSKRGLIGGLIIIALAAIGGGLYYHHHEYQAVVYHLSDGSSITTSRHNFNELSPSAKQAFLNPVNKNALHSCVGNSVDQCIATPSIDFWPAGSEGASNPLLQAKTTNPDEIMGRIITQSGNNLQLKTTSGRIFTIAYPLDVLTNFNNNYAPNYGITVGNGDEIYVSYYGSKPASTTIATNQIISSSIIIKNSKSSPIEKY